MATVNPIPAITSQVQAATNPRRNQTTATTDPAARCNRRRPQHHRRQFRYLPAAADHAAEEPEPARSARHQPVHPAAGAVRAGRAADQAEPAARNPDLDREVRAGDHRARLVGATVAVDGQTAALKNGSATWTFNVPKPVDRDRDHQERDRPDRLYRQLHDERRRADASSGTATTTTACNGRTATTPSRSPARTPAARPSRSRARSRAWSTPSTSPRRRRSWRSAARPSRSTRSSAWCDSLISDDCADDLLQTGRSQAVFASGEVALLREFRGKWKRH